MRKFLPLITIPAFVLSLSFALILLTGPVNQASLAVLCYHSFLGRPDVSTDFSLSELENHIRILKKRGYRFVTLDMVRHSELRGTRNVLITIDDANHSVYQAYKKVFAPHRIKPVLGVYTHAIGHRYFLSWPQIRELSSNGWEIASHGHFHLSLTNSMLETSPDKVFNELVLSRKIIKDNTGKMPSVYIYPYGNHETLIEELIKLAGYEYAFGLDRKIITFPLKAPDNHYSIPRYMLLRKSVKKTFNEFLLPLTYKYL